MPIDDIRNIHISSKAKDSDLSSKKGNSVKGKSNKGKLKLHTNILLSSTLLADHDYVKLGMIALGKRTIDEWTTKGLAISTETLIVAGKVFREAVSSAFQKNELSSPDLNICLNKHEIVSKSQAVPDWFKIEYQQTLSNIINSKMKKAFEKSGLYFSEKQGN